MNRVNKTNLIYIYIYIYIFHTSSRATLKETFTAKYIVVMPRTPYKVRPKSELTPLSETTNIPAPLIWESPPRDLNSVSNVCEAAPRSWFCAPNGLNELLEAGCAFPFILTGKSTVAFLTGLSWRELKSWYTGGGPEQWFQRCFADWLDQSFVSSATQAK